MVFSEWLRGELNSRGWSQNELGRRAGLTSAAVSLVMTQMRQPGPEFCQGVARAFRIPETVVFEQAGLLSPARGEGELTRRELYELLKDLPVEEQRAILADARGRWERTHEHTARSEPAAS